MLTAIGSRLSGRPLLANDSQRPPPLSVFAPFYEGGVGDELRRALRGDLKIEGGPQSWTSMEERR